MRKMIKYGTAVICLLATICMGVVGAPIYALAAEAKVTEEEILEPEPYIVVEGYELSHERVVPGMGFTLTLKLKNNSTTRTVQHAMIDIGNPNGVTPVYGTVTQLYLGNMQPGETREVSFDYEAWSSINAEALSFSVSLISMEKVNKVEVRVPTGTDNVFHVMAASGPSTVYVDETVSFSLNFRVLGDENVSDVVLRVDCEGDSVGYSQVGSLIAGTTKTQSVSFTMSKAGTYTADFYMEYLGADGQTKSEYLSTKEFEVRKVETVKPSEPQQGGTVTEPQPDDTDAFVLAVSGVLILAIFVVSAIILKKKR